MKDKDEYKGFLPCGTILGELEMEEVYEYYDRPVLFVCKNEDKQRYLAVLIDQNDRDDIFFFSEVSTELFHMLLLGQKDIRFAFQNPSGKLFKVTLYTDPTVVEEVTPWTVTDEFLPVAGETL